VEIIEVYKRIFKEIWLDAKVIEAAEELFTGDNTHEFQVLAENGEDTIFYCNKCDFGENKELGSLKWEMNVLKNAEAQLKKEID